ncbi:MAG: hypothetical protein MK102_05865 [Fuerstiella sp.]|nr:hypothetical protein [Fuerstiella sp.]
MAVYGNSLIYEERIELEIYLTQEIQEQTGMGSSTIKEDVVLLASHKTDNILMGSHVISIGDTRVTP